MPSDGQTARPCTTLAGSAAPWALHCTSTSPSTGPSTHVGAPTTSSSRRQIGRVADDDRARPRGRRRPRSASDRRPAGRAPGAGRSSRARRRRRRPSAPAGGVDDVGGMEAQTPVEEVAATARRRDEADVLAVGLRGRAQAELDGERAHRRPCRESPDREHRAGERRPGRACARRSSGPWPGRRHARACAGRPPPGRRVRGARWRRRRSRAGRRARRGGRTSPPGCTRCTGSASCRPACAATYGSTTDAVEVVGEVEHEVVDVELLGDAPGIVDVGDAAAPGVALAAPQPHRDADDVVAGAPEQRGGDRRVDAAAHRDHHLHDRHRLGAPRPRSVRDGRGDRVDTGVDVGGGRRAPEREPQRAGRPRAGRRPSRRARATGPSRRSRTPTPPTRRHRPRRAGTAAPRSRCPRSSRAPTRRPCRRARRSRARPGTPVDEPADEAVAQRGERSTLGVPFGVRRRERRRPRRRCRRRCACRCGARAPGRRRRSAGRSTRRHGSPARRRPSARRTCGRSATAGRRAATRHAGRASTPPARRRCAAARAGRGRARPRRQRPRSVTVPTSLLTAITLTIATSSPSAAPSCIEIDAAAGIDADDGPAEPLDRVQHGVVLGGRADGATAATTAPADGTGDRRVVGLGAAPREHDLARPAADDVGDDVARLVDGPPGVTGEAVRTTRVGEALGEERQHRRDGVLAHRRRRRVVEVDRPVHPGSR